MTWQKRVFEDFRLYAVTDLNSKNPEELRKIESAYAGGADIIQLRSKTLCDAALIRLGLKMRQCANRYRKLLFINDRIDVALAVQADGVHLGQEDMPLVVAQKIASQAGAEFLFGKSTHDIRQALAAVKEGADYIGVGPVFKTPTKPNARAVGLRFVRQAAKRIRIPWVAIGGINLENAPRVLDAGAYRIAVVRAIFSQPNPKQAAQQLAKLLRG